MLQTQVQILAERLCRPQRIGVFGHRGVGKTTFVTMLYREAVGGRLPGLRLASADAKTAEYLSDKILQLEAGQPLPATLAETDLHFHLYYQGSQLDLLLRDYQGEHVALGREEPIRAFLRDCDAVWLCLDVTVADTSATCLRSEQEVEQLVEDYLVAQPPATPHRPMALLLTKADLLKLEERSPGAPDNTTALHALVEERFAMTRHALHSHCPRHEVLAVSSLGGSLRKDEADPVTETGFQPRPTGLAEPLLWLVRSLQAQDVARLEQIWQLAPNNLLLLQRCVSAFARRYPATEETRVFQKRLRRLSRERLRRRTLVGLGSLLVLLLSLWGYDSWGRQQTQSFARTHAGDPEAVLRHFLSFQTWHPTRHLFHSAAAEEQQVRTLRCQAALADLHRRLVDPDANPEAVWEVFRRFRADFPERDVQSDMEEFGHVLKARAEAERERRAQIAFEELERLEAQTDLSAQLARAERFLKDHGGTKPTAEVQKRVTGYLQRLDQRDIETARTYSARNPLNFSDRRAPYLAYLQRHPQGAAVKEAHAALTAIDLEWDRHDFRPLRNHFLLRPAKLEELEVLCNGYLYVHEKGRYCDAANSLLRWSHRSKVENEYKVKLVSGSFDTKSTGYFSRGMNLSVELEVNGIVYGPSTIAKRTSEPTWNYEFPRPIKWKMGDPVRIKVTDAYYWNRTVWDYSLNGESDPVTMKYLSGEVASGKNRLVFESDFVLPTLPSLE